MDIYEEMAMYFVTANKETFVSPQYDIGNGWSCPDFVAMRPPKRTVYIVEVSAGGNLSGLAEKVLNYEGHWLNPLREHLMALNLVDSDWSFKVLVFIRRDQLKWFKTTVDSSKGVVIICLEDVFKHWLWDNKVWTGDFLFGKDSIKRK